MNGTSYAWTAYVTWAEGWAEEVDVIAPTRSAARSEVKRILAEDYDEGWRIRSVTRAFGVMVVTA